MRENRASSPGRMKNSSYYIAPGRGSNSRPPAHRSFKHGQGVPRSYPLGYGGGRYVRVNKFPESGIMKSDLLFYFLTYLFAYALRSKRT